MMLRYLGETSAADRLQQAVEDIIAEGKHVTYDLAPSGITPVGTQEMAEAIAAKLAS